MLVVSDLYRLLYSYNNRTFDYNTTTAIPKRETCKNYAFFRMFSAALHIYTVLW